MIEKKVKEVIVFQFDDNEYPTLEHAVEALVERIMFSGVIGGYDVDYDWAGFKAAWPKLKVAMAHLNM